MIALCPSPSLFVDGQHGIGVDTVVNAFEPSVEPGALQDIDSGWLTVAAEVPAAGDVVAVADDDLLLRRRE